MRPKVFVPEMIAASGLELLRASCDVVTDSVAGADAAVVRLHKLDRRQITEARNLKVIAKHGVGVDNIDVAAASERRIPVVFTPTANANAVAEHTLALMLALARNLAAANARLMAGEWLKFEGIELTGRTLGVIGLGRIGARVAAMARDGFAMTVIAYDPLVSVSDFATVRPLEDVLRVADFLTLHLPLTAQTRHLIGAEQLRLLKPTCRIINTSRGGVLDETAVAEALVARRIAGVALDVFENEPLPLQHPLRTAPHALLTPHIASSTTESLERMARDAATGVLDVLAGRRPAHVVNPEVLP